MIESVGQFEIVPGIPPKRNVRVYVPSRAPAHDRPVLFMFDGQNVFDDQGSFAGGWHAHRAVERLAKTVTPPAIVALDHGHEHRISELSPFDFGRVKGSLDGLLEWIGRWLLPELRGKRSLTADPRRVVVAGSSMGGIAALYAALSRPDLFGGAIAMSPSLWIGGGKMFSWARERALPQHERIYLDCGALEGPRMFRAAEEMARLLRARGVGDVMFRGDPKGRHREIDWRRRLLPALRFHFGTSRARR
jgi:enterochelin esterase-like enzyme